MKPAFVLLFILVATLLSSSCNTDEQAKHGKGIYKEGYEIHQFFMKDWRGATTFNTWIYLDGELIKAIDDDRLQNISDSVKQARLNEAIEYVGWIKKFGQDTSIVIPK